MIDYIFIGFITLLGIGALFCMVMMWRIVLVCSWRLRANQTSIEDYRALPEFETMMWMVWVWRLEGFPRRDKLEDE